jgi:hypothetical protein
VNDQELKLNLLEKAGGDVLKAKEMYDWVATTPSTPDPTPTPEGIVLLDSEVIGSSPEALWKLAMERLAVKQNAPVAEVKGA